MKSKKEIKLRNHSHSCIELFDKLVGEIRRAGRASTNFVLRR